MQKRACQLKDLVGAKITKILFSQEPVREIREQASILAAAGIEDKPLDEREVEYEVDSGNICLVLDNKIVLVFWNSEWGGMTITPEKTFESEQKWEERKEYPDE